jgi:radical SAM family uncharacterized protein/radical SAM-linked protein
MNTINITDYLTLVRKPGRYIGGEVNSIKKDPSGVRLTFGLAFPDTYEVGMSHLGVQVLYQILNSREDIACERVFAPWTDMEALLREKGAPLTTLESKIPLSELDILGFSLQYELSYTNVLNMLELGDIPLLSTERSGCDPFVIGGGPCAFNPEPVAGFFDCFLLGDGEEAVLEIADVVSWGKKKGLSRGEILESLLRIEGVYVPSFFDVAYNTDGTVKEVVSLMAGYEGVKKRIVPDLNALPLPTSPVVPFYAVHDRLSVEIVRGCTRGCRFCQAGMVYRPLRERDPDRIERIVKEALKTTGYEEVGLLSLSTGDYTSIEGLLCSLMPCLEQERISVSLPSLRVGTLGAKLASEIKRVRKTGFTLAPEAGSPRLRNLINKGIDEADLINGAQEVFGLGWRSLKLYFMIGLPTETDEDVQAIVHLAKAVKDAAKMVMPKVSGGSPKVNVSVSTFVPKPFTPFQWEPQTSREYAHSRLGLLKREAKRMKLGFKWNDPVMSFLEGVFSRGDRRLVGVILRAFKKGCRFDGWTEEFRFDLWKKAFAEEGMGMEFYIERKRRRDEILPWDHLGSGLTKEFLYKEYERSLELKETPDCKFGQCFDCGVCDHRVVKNRVSTVKTEGVQSKSRRAGRQSPSRARFSFSKTGNLKYLSHLELVKVITRAIRRAGLPVMYSQGHHPLPRVSFCQSLPVGIESVDEYMDIEFEGGSPAPERIADLLNATLPAGLKILGARFIPLQLPSLSAIIKAQHYMISLENGPLGLNIDSKRIDGFLRDFLMMDSIVVHIERADKSHDVDIRPLLGELSRVGDLALGLMLKSVNGASIRPSEVLARLFNLSKEQASLIPIRKTRTVF